MRALVAALRRRQHDLRADPDRGTTLMELMVGMALMSIFMGIFTVAVVGMFSATNKIQAVENSSAQLNTAFDRLDRQVRYASAIDSPVAPTTANLYWSVSFKTVDPTPATDPTLPTCTQLAVGIVGGVTQPRLAERTWQLNADGSVVTPVPGWSQLAAGVTNGTASASSPDQPFTLPTVVGSALQQLHLRLIAQDGAGLSTTSVSEVTFTALNSGATRTALASGPQTSACTAPGGV